MTKQEIQAVIDKGGYFVIGENYIGRIENRGFGVYGTLTINMKTGVESFGSFTTMMDMVMNNIREATREEVERFVK